MRRLRRAAVAAGAAALTVAWWAAHQEARIGDRLRRAIADYIVDRDAVMAEYRRTVDR